MTSSFAEAIKIFAETTARIKEHIKLCSLFKNYFDSITLKYTITFAEH